MVPTGRSPSSHLNRRSSRNQLSCLWHSFRDAVCTSLTICTCTTQPTSAVAYILKVRIYQGGSGPSHAWRLREDVRSSFCEQSVALLLAVSVSILGANLSHSWAEAAPVKPERECCTISRGWGWPPHQSAYGDVRGVPPTAMQELHGLAVADGARSAALIRQQALTQQPIRLLWWDNGM